VKEESRHRRRPFPVQEPQEGGEEKPANRLGSEDPSSRRALPLDPEIPGMEEVEGYEDHQEDEEDPGADGNREHILPQWSLPEPAKEGHRQPEGQKIETWIVAPGIHPEALEGDQDRKTEKESGNRSWGTRRGRPGDHGEKGDQADREGREGRREGDPPSSCGGESDGGGIHGFNSRICQPSKPCDRRIS